VIIKETLAVGRRWTVTFSNLKMFTSSSFFVRVVWPLECGANRLTLPVLRVYDSFAVAPSAPPSLPLPAFDILCVEVPPSPSKPLLSRLFFHVPLTKDSPLFLVPCFSPWLFSRLSILPFSRLSFRKGSRVFSSPFCCYFFCFRTSRPEMMLEILFVCRDRLKRILMKAPPPFSPLASVVRGTCFFFFLPFFE